MAHMDFDDENLLPPFTLEQLHSFAGLVRWGKQAAVTAALGKSQPQISRDLAALEKGLGQVLFDRSARQPTVAGEHVLIYATSVLEGWHQLHAQLREATALSGRVALDMSPEVCPILLPVLSTLQRRCPELRLETQLGETDASVQSLRAGTSDVAILLLPRPSAGVHTRPLAQARMVVALPVRSPLAKRKQISPRLLAGQTVLLPGYAPDFCEEANRCISGRTRLRTLRIGPGHETLLEAVVSGLGVAVLPSFAPGYDPLLRDLPAGIVLKPLASAPPLQYSLAVRDSLRPGGAASILIKYLLREFNAA